MNKIISIPTVSICDHLYDAKAAICQNTDTLSTGTMNAAELFGFKNNIQLTVFLNSGSSFPQTATGKIKFALYIPTDKWKNEDQFFARMTLLKTWMKKTFGKYLSTGSYRNGNTEYKNHLLKYLLGARNSEFPQIGTNGKTDYGTSIYSGNFLGLPQQPLSRLDKISAASSSRNLDMAGTWAQKSVYLTEQIQKTIADKGFYNDFMHWHNISNFSYFDTFFGLINTAIGGNFVWRCSYSEAIEYLFLREMVSSVTAIATEDSITINLLTEDKFNGDEATLQELITVPLSLRVDLTGTSFDGFDITCNGTIKRESCNVYVLQIPFDTITKTFPSVIITATATPAYLNFSLPVITSTEKTATTITVNTNIKTKAVLFKVVAGGDVKNSIAFARSNTYSTIHNFTISTTDDFRVGILSETNQSILSEIIN